MNIRNCVVRILSTFFYVGYLPLIPGTFASIAGLLLFYLIKDNYFIATFSLLVLGFLVSGKAEDIFGKKDAKFIVIDEVSGMLLSLMFLPYDIKLIILALILFRAFDALKPYPINMLQGLKGSLGIMSDDIAAGLCTNIILQVVFRLASFKMS